MNKIRQLNSSSSQFQQELKRLKASVSGADSELRVQVATIIDSVARGGDVALLEYTLKYDQNYASSVASLKHGRDSFAAAWQRLPAEQKQALQFAAERIRSYHQHQVGQDWHYQPDLLMGQKLVPLQRVGIYSPGGLNCYPSSVLMSAVVARVAGVAELVLVSPNTKASDSGLLMAAAYIADVDQLIEIGGAQAIAALACGTESIEPVDKIVGPGNKYVAEAKRQVFGRVGIDMVAGPSEVVIVADSQADPDWIAADMIAQAEHDADARAILLSPDAELLKRVLGTLPGHWATQPRRATIVAALQNNGALIHCRDLTEAVDIADSLAPEHLQLMLAEPQPWLERIRRAGAVFLGYASAEVFGDYCAGSNHVLPTGGAGRYAQALGVYDFVRRLSYVGATQEQVQEVARHSATLAHSEALFAHQSAAQLRLFKH